MSEGGWGGVKRRGEGGNYILIYYGAILVPICRRCQMYVDLIN